MSDPPEKPKVGSLRDRIAAFEKPAAGNSPSVPAPAPRQKPGGYSWKPKAPSPPPSPGGADHAVSAKTGMSASDAKESIGKGGSLKDRMAALQGKGAFGSPPPVAPKPAVGKPKWKPPPVVAPVDTKDEDEDPPTEPSTSPPPPSHPKQLSADDAATDTHEGTAPAAEGEEQPEIDPEEEERQRRAAIAARMARLGGARVGVAPMFGRPPVAKKPGHAKAPSLEDDVQPVASPVEDATPAQVVNDALVTSPPAEIISEEQVGTPAASVPGRKSSESLSQPSVDNELQASRNPNSMPLPSAPRRAAPPRKKAAKSPTPPVAVVDVPLTESPDILSTVDTPTITKKAEVGDVEREVSEVSGEVVDLLSHAAAAEVAARIPEKESDISVVAETRGADNAVEPTRVRDNSEIAEADNRKSADIVTSPLDQDVFDHAEDDNNEGEHKQSTEVRVEHEHTTTKSDKGPIVQSADDPDEDEVAARRKRVAGKLAKMGGINPLAPPPQRRPSTDGTQTSPPASPLVKRASLSRQSADTFPSAQRRRSLRKSSVDSTMVPETDTTSTQRKPSFDGTQPSPSVSPRLVKRISISRQGTDSLPPQRKQSLRELSADSTAGTTQIPEPHPNQSFGISPPSRKSSVDLANTETASDFVSGRESQDVAGHVGQGLATTHIPEGSEPISDTEEVSNKREALTEEPKLKVKGELEVKPYQELDVADEELATLVVQTPPLPNWTTRPQEAPVDPALAVDHIPIPPRSLEQVPPVAAPPPTRLIPPPPPVFYPRHDDEDASGSEYEDFEEKDVSHQALPQQTSEDEGSPLPRQMRLRLSNDDNDNDSAPLPIPSHRPAQPFGGRSPAISLTSSSRPARRSLPPPPPPPQSAPASDIEPDSDLDEILPTPPRHRPTTPGTPPPNEVPLIVPPPHSEDLLKRIAEPSPLRYSYAPQMQAPSDFRSPTPDDRSPASDQEILDEEEGDPIDPAFHSPSRPGSIVNLAASAAAQATDHIATEQSEQPEDVEQVKRTTIADRMAKLGGIKFGAAPIPPSIGRPPPSPDGESGTPSSDAIASEGQVEIGEEEEERARKERIAAKLAGMGGMRIGMMPLGPGALRPQQSHALTKEGSAASPSPAATNPPPPSRGVPPSRPPPPSHSDSDLEHEGMSVSHHSLSTSEEGVKVEAEESEMEEISYEDAKEEEEVVPPVPTRPARRSTSETEPIKTLTVPAPRPPVPTSLPTRRASIQSTASARKSSAESNRSPRRSATVKHQSDYVMVEEPKGFMSDEVPPPPPPGRPISRASSTREVRPSRLPPADPAGISSQWELPSIPSSSLEFGGNTDLSLSWSDAGATESTLTLPPPRRSSARSSQIISADQTRSADDLIAIWGRVGVQICEVATSMFEKSKKSLVGDGSYYGFVKAVVSEVPNAVLLAPPSYGYVVYEQSGSLVQKRASEIMPGDVVELKDAKFKGHKGLQSYSQHVGAGEPVLGVVSEFEPKKSKVKLFQANQHVGQQTVEAVSYRLEDLKSGAIKAYRILEA